MGAVQRTGAGLKVGLGEQGVGVGGPHPLGQRRGNRVGQPVAEVAGRMECLASQARTVGCLWVASSSQITCSFWRG
jgi:hypothetical protein